jgi:multiple sugar transport system permease protein
MILGLCIALAVNTVPRMLKGTVIFFSLVPMLITPLVGRLILYWMLNSEGILGAAIRTSSTTPACRPAPRHR